MTPNTFFTGNLIKKSFGNLFFLFFWHRESAKTTKLQSSVIPKALESSILSKTNREPAKKTKLRSSVILKPLEMSILSENKYRAIKTTKLWSSVMLKPLELSILSKNKQGTSKKY